jgi:hypothetical protein
VVRHVLEVPTDNGFMDLSDVVQQKGHIFLKIKELLWVEMISLIAAEMVSLPNSSADLFCFCMHPNIRYIMLLNGIIARTVELHLSRLIGTLSHPDMQKVQIIEFFF